MADLISTLLGFSHKITTPYDTLPTKSPASASKYSPDPPSIAKSKLAGGFTTALTAIIDNDLGKEKRIAIGKINDDIFVAEYHSSTNANLIQFVAYDRQTNEIIAMNYDQSTSTSSTYELAGDDSQNGHAVHCALFLEYMLDEEFADTYEELKTKAAADYPDRIEASKLMGILNDNVYRRMKKYESISKERETARTRGTKLPDYTPECIGLPEISSKNLPLKLMKNAALTSGKYNPESTIVGEFEVLSSKTSKAATKGAKKTSFTKEDLMNKFMINPSRVFTAQENAIKEANKLEDFYIVSKTDIDICNIIQKTTETNIPFRVFTFRGEAGSGKSEKAKAIANGLGLPFVTYTCSSNTEIFDFIGQVMPDTNGKKVEGHGYDEALVLKLEKMGGVTFDNIAKAIEFPSLVDIDFDPAMAYEEMTSSEIDIKNIGDKEIYSLNGEEIGDITAMRQKAISYWQSVMSEKFDMVISTIRKMYGDETKFIYTETDFIRAVKYGWVCEIQEPNVILSEGVLVGLNGLLAEGHITLPTGESINRHPDCVIIFTTNVTYNGCREMNQSVIDRSNKVYDIDAPTAEIMAERAMSISGNTDEDQVLEMANIIKDIASEMQESGIDDGVCGMRSLVNWAIASRFENPYEAFNECVLSKTSMDSQSRESLKKRIDESNFRPVKRRRGI